MTNQTAMTFLHLRRLRYKMKSSKKVVCTILTLACISLLLSVNLESEELIQTRHLYRLISDSIRQDSFYGHLQLKENLSYFEGRTEKVTPLNFNFMIKSNVCQGKPNPLLLILVLSKAENARQRHAIRSTYGSVVRGAPWPSGDTIYGDVNLVFLFGKTNSSEKESLVQKEAVVFGDIVQADFVESYYNLTYKVLMGIKWVKNFCPGAINIMKADEDTFMDIPRLTNIMASTDMTNIIYGHFHFADDVGRTQKKTKVAMGAFPFKYYLPHVKGNMYFMSKTLAFKILELSEYFPYVNIEDAHITGTLPNVLKARHLNIPKSQYNPNGGPHICDFALKRKIVAQQVDSTLAYGIWRRIQNAAMCAQSQNYQP